MRKIKRIMAIICVMYFLLLSEISQQNPTTPSPEIDGIDINRDFTIL